MPEFSEKILIIAYHYPPDARVGAKRFSFISKMLEPLFSEVHVLSVKDTYYNLKDFTMDCSGKTHRVSMFPKPAEEKKTLLHRFFYRIWNNALCLIDPTSGWVIPAFLKGMTIVKSNDIDSIIATGPPFTTLFIGYLIKLFTGKRLVLDYRDPWSNHKRSDISSFLMRMNKITEKLIIKKADAIVFCTEIMKNNFISTFGSAFNKKAYIVSNGFTQAETIKPLSLESTKKTLIYAGNFYGDRSISLISGVLARLVTEGIITQDNFCFHIFGRVRNKDLHEIKEKKLSDLIVTHKPVPYKTILQYLKGADILFLPSGASVGYALPYKFFDYLKVEKPVFASAPENSSVAMLMRNISCGLLCPPYDEELASKNLKQLISDQLVFDFAGKEAYTWEKLSERYADILTDKKPEII